MLLSLGWATAVLLAVLLLAVGSFVNVVVHRLPIMLERNWRNDVGEAPSESSELPHPFNLAVPRSHCPECRHSIKLRHNIPIASWLLLRGRCPYCSARIPARYPLVEATMALAGLCVLHAFGYEWLTVALLFYTTSLIALGCIDMETRLLPDEITIPLLWVGMLTALAFGHISAADSIIGAAAGYMTLWIVYWAFKLLTGREGMGHGDFKLLAALGAWLGWQALLPVILIASLSGLLYAAFALVRRQMTRHQPIPFGPFLAAAGWVTLIFREELIAII